MATINFYLDKLDKKGSAPIHLRINCKGAQIKLSTGRKVNPKRFDKESQRVKGKSKKALETNHYLKFLDDRADELLHHSDKKKYTHKEIKKILNQHIESLSLIHI